MSESPLSKKLKQTELDSFLDNRQINIKGEHGETTQASGNVQGTMTHSIKTEAKGGPSNDVKQEVDAKKHTFNFNLNFKTYSVSCTLSMTVLEGLNTSKTFRMEKNKKKNMEKEIIIQKYKDFPKAAVKTDFPCCLINEDETIEVTFIKTDGNNSTNQQTTATHSHRKNIKPDTLVSFWVEKDGGDKVKCLLKSKALRRTVRYVCVYGYKGEKVKNALERDGRFNSIIFEKHCGLAEFGRDTIHELSIPVEDLDRKAFQVVVISDKILPDSQEDQTFVKPESSEASDSDEAGSDVTGHIPTNTQQKKKKNESTKSKNPSAKRYVFKTIEESEDLLEFLRAQHKDLMKTLMQRENLKNTTDVQRFFRAEYDKSVQSFSEVFKIKQLMGFSESVCQIRVNGFGTGTGFLFFGRYILTNAHVVKGLLESQNRLTSTINITAAFDFECLDSSLKLVSFKQEIPAYCFITDDKNRRLDFALLELEGADEIKGRPQLLECYRPGPPPNSGGICIVGHPDSGIKKMDACYIIGKENLQEAVDKYKSANPEVLHVITQRSFEDIMTVYENQITYDSCFFGGSSGSPVFDEHCSLIGIHTGGYVYQKEGSRIRSVKEYSYSMQPILDMIRAKAKINGFHEIVHVLEKYRYNESVTAEQNYQDVEMEDAEMGTRVRDLKDSSFSDSTSDSDENNFRLHSTSGIVRNYFCDSSSGSDYD